MTIDVEAFASLNVGDRWSFFSVNLPTGKAQSRGAFRTNDQVIGIAVPLKSTLNASPRR